MDIITAGVEKHKNHDRKFLAPRGPDNFALIYPDGSEVQYVPGKNCEFLLCDYKEELGKSYQRITLFICHKSDLQLSRKSAAIESDDSVDDDELSNLFENKTSRRVGDETLLPPSEEKPSTSTSSTPIQCPTCFQYFSLEDIAQHADLCVNSS